MPRADIRRSLREANCAKLRKYGIEDSAKADLPRWGGDREEPFMVAQSDPASSLEGKLAASTRVLSLSPGVYRFSVAAGSPTDVGRSGQLVLPAVYLALGPDTPSKTINLIPSPAA